MKSRLCHCIMILFLFVALKSQGIALEPEFLAVPNAGSLSYSTPNVIFKDSRGYVWIGTLKELVMFDGVRSISYTLRNDEGTILPITSITESRDGSVILIGTPVGLYAFSLSSFLEKTTKMFSADISRVNCLERSAKGSILVGTNRGLKVINPEFSRITKVTLSSDSLSKSNNVKALALRENIIYIGTNAGMFMYDLQKDSLNRFLPNSFDKVDVTTILLTDKNVFIGTSAHGLLVTDLDGKNIKHIDAGGNVIRALAKNSEGKIFIGSDGDGILYLNPGDDVPSKYQHLHRESNVPHNNQIYSLLVDESDRMFIGYYLMGASYSLSSSELIKIYSKGEFDTYGMSVRNIMAMPGYLFLGTRDGVRIIDNATGEITTINKPQLRSSLVLSSAYHNGIIYIGTYGGGLSAYDINKKTFIPSPLSEFNVFDSGSIFSIFSDKRGNVWFGTSDGLYKINKEGIIELIENTQNNGTLENIYEVFFDSLGRGWVCTNIGIFLINNDNTLSQSEFPHNFIEKEDVRQIYEGRNNLLYFIGQNGKIWVFNAALQPNSLTNRLDHIENARGIVEDMKNRLWITTSNGLYRYIPSEKRSCHYSYSDGIPSATFNPGTPKIDNNGVLWLGHILGLLYVDTKNPADCHLANKKALPTMIEEESGLHALPLHEVNEGMYQIDLASSQNNAKLYLTDLSYSGNEVSRFEYSIDEGKTWHPIPSNMIVSLKGLKKGETKLKVRQYGSPATEINIRINNPIDSMVVVIITIIILACGLCIVVFFISKYYHKRNNHLKSIKQEKQEIENPIIEENVIEETKQEEVKQSQNPEKKKEDTTVETGNSKKYAANYMSEAECERLAQNMDKLLRETKIYTNPDLKIKNLAEHLGVSSHRLSYLFSQYLHTNYYDYIYTYRVEEFKRLAEADIKKMYTLIALSESAGFNSRTTFFRAFKKSEGMTPGEYLKRLRGE